MYIHINAYIYIHTYLHDRSKCHELNHRIPEGTRDSAVASQTLCLHTSPRGFFVRLCCFFCRSVRFVVLFFVMFRSLLRCFGRPLLCVPNVHLHACSFEGPLFTYIILRVLFVSHFRIFCRSLLRLLQVFFV